MGPRPSDPLDAVNKPVWSSRNVVWDMVRSEGWTDPGEREAILSLAPSVRGQPMLDLGMGGGRSTTWSRLLTDDYVGLDIAPEMVAAAQKRHPGVTFVVGDARDLSAFEDGRFGFVMFSFNGLDAVGHEDRAKVLREIARVLRPGGRLLVSTNNRDAACFGTTPWRRGKGTGDGEPANIQEVNPHRRRDQLEHLTHRAIQLAADPRLPLRRAVSYRRLRRQSEDHDSWSIAPLDAYAFGLLVHWTTLSAACAELGAVGLEPRMIFRSDTGAQVQPADWHVPKAVTCDYVHIAAERTAPGD